MKKYILISITILAFAYIGFCQNYLPSYRKINQQEMMSVPMMMAQKAQTTRNYLDQLTNNILELRSKVTDPILNKYLSTSYKELTAYYDKDLADNQIIAQIKAKERAIREYLVEYNTIDSNANSNNNVNSNNEDLNALIGHNIRIKSICHIFSRPSYDSYNLTTLKVGSFVHLLEITDDIWCQVRVGQIDGYIAKSYLDLSK